MEKNEVTGVLADHEANNKRIRSFDAISAQLEQMEAAEDNEEWVASKMGSGRQALEQLAALLASMHASLERHWAREDEELMPFLRENGQGAFAEKLLAEHKDVAHRLVEYGAAADKLAGGGMTARGLRRESRTLRYSVIDLFAKLRRHEAQEEEIMFTVGHEA